VAEAEELAPTVVAVAEAATSRDLNTKTHIMEGIAETEAATIIREETGAAIREETHAKDTPTPDTRRKRLDSIGLCMIHLYRLLATARNKKRSYTKIGDMGATSARAATSTTMRTPDTKITTISSKTIIRKAAIKLFVEWAAANQPIREEATKILTLIQETTVYSKSRSSMILMSSNPLARVEVEEEVFPIRYIHLKTLYHQEEVFLPDKEEGNLFMSNMILTKQTQPIVSNNRHLFKINHLRLHRSSNLKLLPNNGSVTSKEE
jgi:hypothetical protein